MFCFGALLQVSRDVLWKVRTWLSQW